RDFNDFERALPGVQRLPRWESAVQTFFLTPWHDAVPQAYDLVEAGAHWGADIFVNDGVALGAALASGLLRRRWASIPPFPFCTMPHDTLPPPHFAVPYRAILQPLYQLLNSALELRLAAATFAWRQARAAWKAWGTAEKLTHAGLSPFLVAYPGVRQLEYPRPWPANIQPIGPLDAPLPNGDAVPRSDQVTSWLQKAPRIGMRIFCEPL
ncbi:MAG: hypothetical protein M1296_02690, partial [Chloroflexi bacterium]|nr:hypothetical protein [Chloroflexota bacterium]